MNTQIRLALVAVGLSMAGLAMTASPLAAPAGQFSGEAYPLDTCPVSGEKLDKDAVVAVLADMKDPVLNGTQVKFCCPKCVEAFRKEPEKYVGKMNDAIAKQAGAYPLTTCAVMAGDELDADAKTFVWQNRVYKFCCGKCIGKFKADPAKYAKRYEEMVAAAQKPGYKATACPISGKKLGDGAQDVVVSGRLVRTCCPGCIDAVKADPKAAIAKVDAPAAK